jgi:phage terminase large subunit-like protein
MPELYDLINKYKPKYLIIEDKGSGQQLIQDLKNSYFYNIIEQKSIVDKITRLCINLDAFRRGDVILPKNKPWTEIVINELTKLLGEPSMEDNSGEDKVNVEWEVITEDGTVGTIYDWKEYKRLEGDDVVEFHIGGHTKLDTTIIFRELFNLVK